MEAKKNMLMRLFRKNRERAADNKLEEACEKDEKLL